MAGMTITHIPYLGTPNLQRERQTTMSARRCRFFHKSAIHLSQCNYDIENHHSWTLRVYFDLDVVILRVTIDPEVEKRFISAIKSINKMTSRRGIRSALFRPLDVSLKLGTSLSVPTYHSLRLIEKMCEIQRIEKRWNTDPSSSISSLHYDKAVTARMAGVDKTPTPVSNEVVKSRRSVRLVRFHASPGIIILNRQRLDTRHNLTFIHCRPYWLRYSTWSRHGQPGRDRPFPHRREWSSRKRPTVLVEPSIAAGKKLVFRRHPPWA